MKSKGSLLLMELLIMILVFALAAGLCLQVFAKAGAISERTVRMDQAVLLAQNAAEVLKTTRGDLEKARSLPEGDFRLDIQRASPDIPGLGQAEIRVYFQEDLLVSICTGWQEVIP